MLYFPCSDWVVFPPYINANLTGSEVIDQFKKNSPMNAKVMAALMALYMELDAQLYFNGASTLRRLFLPPAWAVCHHQYSPYKHVVYHINCLTL